MQVLHNLLNNALTAYAHRSRHRRRPPGGRRNCRLQRRPTPGRGSRPEDLPNIFERFYRADLSRARATGGSGLGLTIARRFVEAHGGTITATSRLGQGSTFTVTLPIVTQVRRPAGQQPAPEPAPLVMR